MAISPVPAESISFEHVVRFAAASLVLNPILSALVAKVSGIAIGTLGGALFGSVVSLGFLASMGFGFSVMVLTDFILSKLGASQKVRNEWTPLLGSILACYPGLSIVSSIGSRILSAAGYNLLSHQAGHLLIYGLGLAFVGGAVTVYAVEKLGFPPAQPQPQQSNLNR